MIFKKLVKHGVCVAVVIPAAWRRQLDLKIGDYVQLEVIEADTFKVQKVSADMQKHIKVHYDQNEDTRTQV